MFILLTSTNVLCHHMSYTEMWQESILNTGQCRINGYMTMPNIVHEIINDATGIVIGLVQYISKEESED